MVGQITGGDPGVTGIYYDDTPLTGCTRAIRPYRG